MNNANDPITDEMLSAFIDSQLPQQKMEQIRNAIEADPTIAERIASLVDIDEAVSEHAKLIDSKVLPKSLVHLLHESSDNVVSFKSRLLKVAKPLATIAACLVVSLFAYQSLNAPVNEWNQVKELLSSTQSGTTREVTGYDTEFTGVFSFKTEQNRMCRVYALQRAGDRSENIACWSDSESWELVQSSTYSLSAEEYQPAFRNSEIQRVIDQLAATGALPLDQEKLLLNELKK